jgi:polysaccharide pyruvyl transferase WcaK-like protein
MARPGTYIYGYYGQGNLGDDLLLKAAVGMVRAVRPDAPILVHCRDADMLPDLGDADTRPWPAAAVLADATLSRPVRFTRHFALLRQAFRTCDTLVFGGGTVLQESRSPMSIMLIAAMVELARKMGLRVILLGAGLGQPRTLRGKLAMGRILRQATAIGLRDAHSMELARAVCPTCRPELTADLVFSLPLASASMPRGSGRVMALSIQPSLTGRTDQTGMQAQQALKGLVTQAVEAGRPVRLLVLENKPDGHAEMDDSRAWWQVLGSLLDDPRADIRLVGADVARPEALFDGVSVHVGMRFHGHILAALAGVPFVGLTYDVKITEICRMLAMPCLTVAEASPESIQGAMELAEQATISQATLDALRLQSGDNLRLLRETLA